MYLIANICSQNGPPRDNSVWQGGRVHLYVSTPAIAKLMSAI